MHTHPPTLPLSPEKNSGGTAEHTGCQFNEEKKKQKFVLRAYACSFGLFSPYFSLKRSQGTLGTESLSRGSFGTAFRSPRKLNSTDTNTFMGL